MATSMVKALNLYSELNPEGEGITPEIVLTLSALMLNLETLETLCIEAIAARRASEQ